VRRVHACAFELQMCASYDGTVRNSVGDVLQFVYGEDGMDGQRVESQVRCGVYVRVLTIRVSCSTR
jgi:hypothetical protein